jgi:mercuric ion binding protein
MPGISRADDISVTVKGMVCSFCAQGIKKTFGSNEAVKEIDVNLDSKVVHITTHPQTSLSDDVIKQLITDSGYEVVGIERKADA